MTIQVDRIDLILLAKGIVGAFYKDISETGNYRDAFICINDVNGYQYCLNLQWTNDKSDNELIDFINFFKSKIK